MSREFSKVSPKVWRSLRFMGLESDDSRLLYLYMLSCDHQTSAGCFHLPDAYAAADLKWLMKRLHAARDELVKAGLVVHDAETNEYFVLRWFKHNPPTNPKHQKGVHRLISELDSDHVREAAEKEFDEWQTSKPPPSEPLAANGSRLANSGYLNGRR